MYPFGKELNELSETTKGCACTQGLRDRFRAYTAQKDSLKEVTCVACGKVFWTNAEIECCFDCNAIKKKRQEGNDVNER
jgi:hypothetical protein